MNVEIYSMDATDFTQHANQVKEVLLEALERDGLLKTPAVEIAEKYAIIVTKPGWLGSFWKKVMHSDGAAAKNLRYDVVKAV